VLAHGLLLIITPRSERAAETPGFSIPIPGF
jgi:hypothetical protein